MSKIKTKQLITFAFFNIPLICKIHFKAAAKKNSNNNQPIKNLWLYVGVGAGVLVLALLVFFVYSYRKRRKAKKGM